MRNSGSTIQSIALAVDNDQAGDNFVQKMQEYHFKNADEKVIKMKAAQPHKKWGKDWNDELIRS
ncbi:toprim domain-containing protein [Lactobacillus sp. ESL0791]|uniref:toprim domain-containing protein n=1 Tax=Lactobacillus sp. ESL0791 TaxID=2983234 RepID=UPI0023F6BF54|nr:toprim domain-containing protein [Lactobacillus sp. ESL0791]MDF7639768.1 toprim domain-containing protein [Lactobacillus sp. ESL0791]